MSILVHTDLGTYALLSAFLKRESDGYEPTKAKVFTEAEIKKFIFEAPEKEC